MLRAIISLLCLACCPAPAVAKDIFVDNAQGVDRNNGATALPQGAGNGPVRSISRALLLAEKADRVILANTGLPYQESLTLQAGWHSGFDRSFPFRLVGNGAVLDGTAPVPPEAWETFLGPVFRFQPPRMAHQTLLLEDQPLVRKPLLAGRLPALQPLEWCLYDGYVYFRSESDRLPQQYPLRYGGLQTGLTLYDIHFVEISDLVLRGYQLDGVNVHDNCCGITLTNVTSEHNGRSGFSISGWCKTTLDQCAAAGNGVAQVRVDELAKVTLIGGAYANNGVPALLQLGGRVTRKEPPAPPMPPMAE
jgi:hypothetical protein